MRKSGSVSNVQESELESYRNIRSLKESTDQKDIFHIYKMNCEEINNEPSYVFKTSCKCLEIALKMDYGEETVGPKASEEDAYIDAMHSRVNGYKTVTMWTFHPGMNKVVNLAIMDCHKENTEMLTLFLELFNSALQDLTGNSEYKFNPIPVMCDESGANMNAIERVFGKDFMARVVTCQWHFCQCAKHQLPEINPLERETFTKMVNDLYYSSTVNDYERITNTLHNICSRNGLENWWS